MAYQLCPYLNENICLLGFPKNRKLKVYMGRRCFSFIQKKKFSKSETPVFIAVLFTVTKRWE
jgi:hypothetical protein